MTPKQLAAVRHLLTAEQLSELALAARLPRSNQARGRARMRACRRACSCTHAHASAPARMHAPLRCGCAQPRAGMRAVKAASACPAPAAPWHLQGRKRHENRAAQLMRDGTSDAAVAKLVVSAARSADRARRAVGAAVAAEPTPSCALQRLAVPRGARARQPGPAAWPASDRRTTPGRLGAAAASNPRCPPSERRSAGPGGLGALCRPRRGVACRQLAAAPARRRRGALGREGRGVPGWRGRPTGARLRPSFVCAARVASRLADAAPTELSRAALAPWLHPRARAAAAGCPGRGC